MATVLVVDDDPHVLFFLKGCLERAGFVVLPANDPKQAIACSREWVFEIDVLVADVMMPACSGPQLAEILYQTRPNLAVLFISGYASADLPPLNDRMHFLSKPFDMPAFLASVRALCPPAGGAA